MGPAFDPAFYPFSLTHATDDLRTGLYTIRERIDAGGPAVTVDALWNAVAAITESITADAALLDAAGRPHIHPSVSVGPHVVLDTTNGPILIDEGAVIEPFVLITGPTAIGRQSRIRAGARIYGPTVIGPVCKVGGEVEDSIIHGYSNKQHDGFLGHSWIGSWCNLGAGTTTSDLKNTYGTITLDVPWGPVPTGRRFLGTLMGDHSKTAIGTMLMTGTVAGVSANIVAHGPVPRFVPSFTWKDVGGERYAIDRAIDVARTVMARRNVVLTDADETLLRTLHALDRV